MCTEFGLKPGEKAATPAADDLFTVKTDSPEVDSQRKEIFHKFVAKALFACKRARPDIHLAVAVLATRVKKTTEHEWNKLVRMMKYLNGTQDDVLILTVDSLKRMIHGSDGSHAVHDDFKSHTGGDTTLGRGAAISMSRKQKINTKSSTETEIVSRDDYSPKYIWSKYFMEAQGYPIEQNILLQDNKASILLAENGKRSSSERTRHMNIRYYYLTDEIKRGNVQIEYCPTDDLSADYFTKPLQGEKFRKLKAMIMGHD